MAKKRQSLPPSDPVFQTLFNKSLRKGDLKRVEIIQAAIHSIARLGIEATTFESIAEMIGTGRSHVAYYFPDKKEIIRQTVEIVIAKGQELINERLSKASTAVETLEAYVDGQFEWLRSNPDFGSVMMLFYHYTSFDQSYRDLVARIRESGLNRSRGIVEAWLKEYKTSAASSSAEIAVNVHNILSGSLLYFITVYGSAADDHELKKMKEQLIVGIRTLIEGRKKG